jgi:hypothetical protein
MFKIFFRDHSRVRSHHFSLLAKVGATDEPRMYRPPCVLTIGSGRKKTSIFVFVIKCSKFKTYANLVNPRETSACFAGHHRFDTTGRYLPAARKYLKTSWIVVS